MISIATLILATLVPVPGPLAADLWDDVVRALEKSYYDDDFREHDLPGLVERFADQAASARTLADEREIVHAFLANIPASHLSLLSKSSYRQMTAEIMGKASPTLGLQLVNLDGAYHADWLFEGGPAESAGLLRGDRVLSIDGVPPEESPRLDRRTDDAALPDPPIHSLLCEERDAVDFVVSRGPGHEERLRVEAGAYSGMDAARASARILSDGELRFGYVHFWYIPVLGPSKLLKNALAKEFADCDGLILDLRGRGGAANEVSRILKVLDPEKGAWGKPLVALTHHGTRSAKEVIAYELKERGACFIVGEPTAGAVIPASFREVGEDSVLMFPTFTLGTYTEKLEGIGVQPDVLVENPLPFSAGRDPILQAGVVALRVWCTELAAEPTTR